jgi:hypothetical protein
MKRLGIFLFTTLTALAQSNGDQSSSPHIGVALTVGTLGPGIQVATGISRWLNVRGGFNYFSYSLSGTNDNFAYNGSLRLESGEALVDFFPIRWLHFSGGALVHNGFQGSGSVNVAGGQSFTLNSVTYYSAASNPVTGTGKLVPNSAAPVGLIGFGNLLPRNQHHFAATVDLGVAFQGSLMSTLNLTGSTCPGPSAAGCAPISAQPAVQANVLAEQNKINKDLKPYNMWPIIQVSFGYKF